MMAAAGGSWPGNPPTTEVCRRADAVMAVAIAHAVREGADKKTVFEVALEAASAGVTVERGPVGGGDGGGNGHGGW